MKLRERNQKLRNYDLLPVSQGLVTVTGLGDIVVTVNQKCSVGMSSRKLSSYLNRHVVSFFAKIAQHQSYRLTEYH